MPSKSEIHPQQTHIPETELPAKSSEIYAFSTNSLHSNGAFIDAEQVHMATDSARQMTQFDTSDGSTWRVARAGDSDGGEITVIRSNNANDTESVHVRTASQNGKDSVPPAITYREYPAAKVAGRSYDGKPRHSVFTNSLEAADKAQRLFTVFAMAQPRR